MPVLRCLKAPKFVPKPKYAPIPSSRCKPLTIPTKLLKQTLQELHKFKSLDGATAKDLAIHIKLDYCYSQCLCHLTLLIERCLKKGVAIGILRRSKTDGIRKYLFTPPISECFEREVPHNEPQRKQAPVRSWCTKPKCTKSTFTKTTCTKSTRMSTCPPRQPMEKCQCVCKCQKKCSYDDDDLDMEYYANGPSNRCRSCGLLLPNIDE